MATYHVMPVNDVIEHTDSDDCVCGPAIETVEDDGRVCGFVVMHASLDNREAREVAVAKEADC